MPAEPFPDEPHDVLHRVAHAPDLPVSDPNPIVDGDLEEAQADAERLDLDFLGEGHAFVDEPHLGEAARRKAHMPDWESRIGARKRRWKAAFRIAFPIRCIPLIAPPARCDRRSPDTKSARPDSSAARKSGNRSAGYVRSASRVARYVP